MENELPLEPEKAEFPISLKASIDETTTETQLAIVGGAACRWADVPPEQRPEGPRMDFVMQPLPLTEQELRARWEGVDDSGFLLSIDREITDLFRWSSDAQRQKMVLEAMASNGEAPLAIGSPEFQAKLNERDFLFIDALFTKEVRMHAEGKEPEGRTTFNKTTGEIKRIESTRAMNSKDRMNSARTIATLQNEKRLLTGQATQIVAVQQIDLTEEKEKNVTKKLQDFRKRLGQRGSGTRYTVTERQITVEELPEAAEAPELPEPRVWESVEVENGR